LRQEEQLEHAYLSTQAADSQLAINARDRIGSGLWYNAKGIEAAKNVAHLYSDTLEAARLGNNLSRAPLITEKNQTVNGAGGNTSWPRPIPAKVAPRKIRLKPVEQACSIALRSINVHLPLYRELNDVLKQIQFSIHIQKFGCH
jgi:hypothetical protein